MGQIALLMPEAQRGYYLAQPTTTYLDFDI
jgi:hypothetical protein